MPLTDTHRYLAPICVETPDIEKDVQDLFAIPPATLKILDSDVRQKIEVLSERFEFINHLECLIKFIEANKRIESQTENIGAGKLEVKQVDTLYLMGQDISGADYDLHALVFYLLITCVDTIKGQPKYYSPFKWLVHNVEDFSNKTDVELVEKIKEYECLYSSKFGLRKRFIEAFIKDLPDTLTDEIVDNVLVVRVVSGKIDEKSLSAWNDKGKEQKLKKIADTLYEIRSTYTHASIRTFMPIMVLSSAILKDGTTLLYKKNAKHFLQLTREIILELVKTLPNGNKET